TRPLGRVPRDTNDIRSASNRLEDLGLVGPKPPASAFAWDPTTQAMAGRKDSAMFHNRLKLDCDWIRDMLEDLAKPFRGSFAIRMLSLVEAELREIDNLLQPIVQAFRRVC